jgi:hypothetical protein
MMRAIFSILGLVIVVAIVGLVAKKQLGAGVAPTVAPGTAAAANAAGLAVPTGTPQQQIQQFQNAVQGAMQQARPMPDTDK